MKTAEALRCLLGSALLSLVAACGPAGGEQVSSNHVGRLSFSTTTTNPTIAVMAPTQAAIVVQHVWISLEGLRFYGCSGYNETEIADKLAADLAQNKYISYELPRDEFCSLTSAFVPAPHPIPGDAPFEFVGRTIVVEGTRASDGRPFVLASEDAQVVRLQSPGELPIGDAPTDFVLSLDVGRAFAGIDLGQATSATTTVVLDNTNNGALLAQFERQLLDAFSLHLDADSNSRVDPSDPAVATAPR